MMKKDWKRLLVAGLAAGLVVNVCEWVAHRIWLDEAWRDAFAALGKTPKGWAVFIPGNFVLGLLAVLMYRWLSRIYGAGLATALRTALAIWCIFWVIPIAALAPMELFPGRLLLLTILVGVLDGGLATLIASWLYDGWGRPERRARINSAMDHS